jgi:hypothetical protein
VQSVADHLPGDWLLVGGALVALWLDTRRVTEDVDLVGIEGSGADRLSLLGLARDLGLPVEALNSAADFFVHRVPDWRQQIEPFRIGKTGRVFRPSPTLFLVLKIRRLSTRDLDDCLELLWRCSRDALVVDTARVLSALGSLPPADDPALTARRSRLRSALERG